MDTTARSLNGLWQVFQAQGCARRKWDRDPVLEFFDNRAACIPGRPHDGDHNFAPRSSPGSTSLPLPRYPTEFQLAYKVRGTSTDRLAGPGDFDRLWSIIWC